MCRIRFTHFLAPSIIASQPKSKQYFRGRLAYSGGLDTSIIIPWLQEHYDNCEVIAVCGNVGQKGELDGLEERTKASGASKLYVEDLTDEFVDNYVIPTMQAGADYEGYLLGTSFARPILAKRVVEIARAEGANAVCHGSTGFEKGVPVKLNGEKLKASAIIAKLNEVGGRNGIGLYDVVENRLVGMKSRGVYETPGGALLYKAHLLTSHFILAKSQGATCPHSRWLLVVYSLLPASRFGVQHFSSGIHQGPLPRWRGHGIFHTQQTNAACFPQR